MRIRNAKLIEGPVGETLMRLVWPMFWGILSMMLFNLVDTFFVGQLGATPLAAIGFTFPVVFVITGTAMGLGIGMSSVVSRAIGSGDHDRVVHLTTYGLALAVLIVTGFVVVGLLTHDVVFSALGASDDLIALIRTYMIPWYWGVGFLVVPMVGNSAIRATGDAMTPSLIMISAGIVNVVLDPLLIFGIGPFPRLELTGAALATVISYVVVSFGAFYILHRREHMIRLERTSMRDVVDAWRRLLYIALPAIGTNLLTPLGVGVLTRILSHYGPDAVAAYGVGSRLESLAMAACFALSTVMAPFAGQNFGANRCDRVEEGIRFGLKYCLTVTITIWIVMCIFADGIARLFSQKEEIVQMVKLFVYVVPASYGGFGFMLQVASSFNASNKPLQSAIIFISRLFVLTIPLALLGAHVADVPGVFVSMFVGNIGAGIIAYALIERHIRMELKVQGEA